MSTAFTSPGQIAFAARRAAVSGTLNPEGVDFS